MEFLKDVKPIWENNYYDGSLSGVAEYEGEKCYYLAFDDVDDERIYMLVKLSVEEIETLVARHKDFEVMVGTHSTFDDEGKRGAYLDPIDYTYWDKYPVANHPNYQHNELIGHFIWPW